MREALFAALADPGLAGPLRVLGLTGASLTTSADYKRILEIERDAQAAGYPRSGVMPALHNLPALSVRSVIASTVSKR